METEKITSVYSLEIAVQDVVAPWSCIGGFLSGGIIAESRQEMLSERGSEREKQPLLNLDSNNKLF